MAPFRKGLIQNVALCTSRTGIWHLLKAAGPLLVGTIFEYSEWNFLTLFIHQLGPAEGKLSCGSYLHASNTKFVIHLRIFQLKFPISSCDMGFVGIILGLL